MSVPGADRHVQVGHRARAREPRVGMDHRRTALLGLDDPLEADRVLLGHVRAHDQDAVGVLQVLLERGGAAAPKRGPQTGDRGAVSYAGLVLDRERSHRGEELLDQIVLLAVERRAAEEVDPERALERLAVIAFPPPRSPPGPLMMRSAIISLAVSSELLPIGRRRDAGT